MSSTYSPILRSELIGAGDQAGTWGNTTNSNFQYVFESAIAGYVAVTVSPTANNQVLTYVNGPSAAASLDQSIYALLKLDPGSLGANFNIFAPPVSKTYVVWNNTAYTATFYNSTVIGNTTPGGSGAVIPAGAKVLIWSDGTSFYGVDTVLGNFKVAGNLSVLGSTALTGNLTGSTAAFSGAISSVSPSFTGVPTAPTAAGGTNTTQIATTAFVTSVVNTLGTMATQNANAVNITGGTLTGMTNVAGGTHSGTTATFTTFNGAGTGLTGTASGLNIGGTATNATNLTGVAGLAGYSVSGQDVNYSGQGGPQTQGQGGGAAMVSFHRPGSYAINFGLGTDNQLRTGGWSRGGSFVVLDAGNYNSYAPTLTGGNASGTWGINITGNSNYANSAGSAPANGGTATYANYLNNTAAAQRFNWSGQGGQPTWLWGANDPNNAYVYNPSNFSVNYANTAGNAGALNGRSKLGLGMTGETWQDLTGSRAQNVTYYAPDYPIQVSGNYGCNGGGQGYIVINGVTIAFWQAQFNGCGGYSVNMPCIVPPNASYYLTGMGGGARGWYELR